MKETFLKETRLDQLSSKKSLFDSLRLLAAGMVIFNHSFRLVNHQDPTYKLLPIANGAGSIAVCIFFLISGYLVTGSYIRRNNFFSFIRSRFLRIFPGLAIAVLFCALIIGPLFTTLPLSEYFTNNNLYLFIHNNILLQDLRWDLPGTFQNNPLSDAVNGSLWSLPVEVGLYVLVAILGMFEVFSVKSVANIMIFLLIGTFFYTKAVSPEFYWYLTDTAVAPIACFAIGALAWINREKIKLSLPIFGMLLIACYMAHNTVTFPIVFYITFAYAIALMAYQPYINLNFITKYGDYSYGMYIYAFPIQQAFIDYFHLKHAPLVFALSLPTTFIFAVLSWHFVESKFSWPMPNKNRTKDKDSDPEPQIVLPAAVE